VLNRREFIRKAGFATVACTLAAGVNPAAGESQPQADKKADLPNIVVILADDLGWGDISCYPQEAGYPKARLRTPNIDSLAAEGVRCTQAYATCMVCAPSRAGLLTGRYQQHFGWYAFVETLVGLPKDELTLAQVLKKQGYSTACIGKWHLGDRLEIGPLNYGFDRSFGFLGGQHDYYNPNLGDPICAFSFDYDAYTYDQDKPVEKIEYLTDELTNQALKYIDKQAEQKNPFFLYLPYSSPHPPMQSTWEALKPYTEAKGGKFDSRDIARAMINSLDSGIGRILDRLLHLGIDDNTLIFFSSDNGGDSGTGKPDGLVQYNGGLRARKGFFWEGGIRVPFIVRWPAMIKEGQTFDKPVSHLDIFATCIKAAGVARQPKKLDGTDLLPYLTGKKNGSPHETLFWGLEDELGLWAVREGDWKLTRNYRDVETLNDKSYIIVTELHNIETDPAEKNDLSKEHPEIVERLTKLRNEFYSKAKPSLATKDVLKVWQEELKARKEKLPNSDSLRRDGAPGHGL